LSLLLIVNVSLLAGSAAAAEPTGLITEAVHREASCIPAALGPSSNELPESPTPTSAWAAVEGLTPAATVVVIVDARTQSGQFVSADAAQVTIRTAFGQTEITLRDRIKEVRTRTRDGSVGGAILGAVGGAVIGIRLAVHLGYTVRCQPSCGGVGATMVLSAAGLPIAGGVLGYRGLVHTIGLLGKQRSTPGFAVLRGNSGLIGTLGFGC